MTAKNRAPAISSRARRHFGVLVPGLSHFRVHYFLAVSLCSFSAMSQPEGFVTAFIQVPAHFRVFRHLRHFMGQDLHEGPGLFTDAPWHGPESYCYEALLAHYLRFRFIPDGLSIEAIRSDD